MSNSVEAKRNRIPVKEMMPAGSIGAVLITEDPYILAGDPDLAVRLRPKTIFSQKTKTLWPGRKHLLNELNSKGITDLSDILTKPYDQLSTFRKGVGLRERLQEYLLGLAKTPEARFIEWVHDVELEPAEPEREMELVSYVNGLITALPSEMGGSSLSVYFGFDDGIKKTLDKVGDLEGRSKQAVDRSLKRIRIRIRDSWGEKLRGYFTLSKESFGRAVLGAVYRKDLPLAWDISRLDLSNSTRQEIESKGSYLLDDLANVNVADIILSEGALANLRQALERVKGESPRKEVELEEEHQKPVNNLLPEVSAKEFTGIIPLSLEHLNLPPKTAKAIKKEIRRLKRESGEPVRDVILGDMIRLFTKEEFIKIPGLGKQGISLVGQQLQRVLKLPEDSQINIESLLMSVFKSRSERNHSKDDKELEWMRMIVEEALIAGCQSVEQILKRFKEREFQESFKNRFGISRIDGWRVRAFIEYVLNHPAEVQN